MCGGIEEVMTTTFKWKKDTVGSKMVGLRITERGKGGRRHGGM